MSIINLYFHLLIIKACKMNKIDDVVKLIANVNSKNEEDADNTPLITGMHKVKFNDLKKLSLLISYF